MTEKSLLEGEIVGKKGDLKRAEGLTIHAIRLTEKEAFKEAIPFLLETQKLLEKWDVQNNQLAEIYDALGTCHYYLGKFESAINYYKKNLSLNLKLLGEQKHANIFTCYRNLSLVYAEIGRFDLALDSMKKSISLVEEIYKNQEHEEVAVSYRELAHILAIKGDLDAALKSNFKALSIFESLNKEDIDFNIALTWNNISNIFNQKGDFQLLEEYLYKVHQFLKKHPDEYIQFRGIVYASLGSLHAKFDRTQKAHYYYDKALQILPKNHIQVIRLYFLKAQLYLSLGKFQGAELLIKKAEKLITEDQFQLNIDCQINFAILYEQQQQFGKADFHFKTAVKYAEKVDVHQNELIVEAFLLYGKHLLFHSNQLKEAEKYLYKVLSIGKISGTNRHVSFNYANYLLSILYQKNSDFDSAFKYARRCINLSISDHQLKNRFDKIPLANLLNNPKKITDIRGLLGGIKQMAALFFDVYSQKKQDDFIVLSVETYQNSIALLANIRQSYLADKDILLLLKKHQDIYPNALRNAFIAQSIFKNKQFGHWAFEISEKGKATILLLQKQENQAKENTVIPPKLLEKERKIKIQICYLEKSIQKVKQSAKWEEVELLNKWEREYTEIYHEFEILKKQLETDYPSYYRQKYSTSTVGIETLQSSLQENQTVVSYFIGKEKIYLFAITADEYKVFALDKPENLSNLIQNYLQSIKHHQKAKFCKLSFQLYQILLQEAIHHIIAPFEDEIKQLFIIPHAELHYLPFETLLIGETPSSIPYQEMNYLLNHCNISYHYSATLLYLDLQKQTIGKQAPREITFTGFAPVYESSSNVQKQVLKSLQKEYATAVNRSEAVRGDGTWMPLPHSKTEVENISQLFEKEGFKSQAFLYETATKKNLEAQISKSRFVLIAAHGIVNNDYPELSGLVLASETMDDRRQTVDGGTLVADECEAKEVKNVVENSPSFDSPFGGGKGEVDGDIWNEEDERNSEQTTAEDCLLNMKEVAMIPMSADLVVLSSCESGIGELHKGEGMMAVNRGFLASGAKNVVSTLFKVNDRASSELTQLLFQYILNGENYVTALQKAKLELLSKEGMGPKAWSGFVLFGVGR